MIRYFLVSYISSEGFGSIWFEHQAFPNYQWLCQKIADGTTIHDVIILGIFEFKNKEDFEDFRREGR